MSELEQRLIATGETRYNGYLKPEIPLIVKMHLLGFSCVEIARRLNETAAAWDETTPQTVRYALKVCGVEFPVRIPAPALRVSRYAAFPPEVARDQAAWERRRRVRRMRDELGMTYREIGIRFDLSGTRVQQLISGADREDRFGHRSPVERYFSGRCERLPPKTRVALSRLARGEPMPAHDWLFV